MHRFLSGNWTDNNIYHIFVECDNKSKDNSLIKFKLDANETNGHYSILWTSSILQSDKIRVVLSPQYLGILDDEDHILYIYDLIHEKYTGFIDLKLVFMNKEGEVIVTNCQECLLFGRNHSKGSLIVYYNDSILLFSQINLDSLDSIQDESWTLIHKFENILNISPIFTIKMEESYYGKLMFIVNNKYFVSK